MSEIARLLAVNKTEALCPLRLLFAARGAAAGSAAYGKDRLALCASAKDGSVAAPMADTFVQSTSARYRPAADLRAL